MIVNIFKSIVKLFKKPEIKAVEIKIVKQKKDRTFYCVADMHELCDTMFSIVTCSCDCHWSEK